MAAVSGIWNHTATAAANPMSTGVKAMDDTSNNGSNGSTSSAGDATISANDFLTLLVTEMQNQDPTADTDPNEYINQLVNVNSLEQLININQTLTTAFDPTTTTSDATPGGAAGAASAAASGSAPASAAAGAHSGAASQAAHSTLAAGSGTAAGIQSSPPATTHGNLSTPRESPSALRVSKALDGQRVTR